jgi:hypothetical protein
MPLMNETSKSRIYFVGSILHTLNEWNIKIKQSVMNNIDYESTNQYYSLTDYGQGRD